MHHLAIFHVSNICLYKRFCCLDRQIYAIETNPRSNKNINFGDTAVGLTVDAAAKSPYFEFSFDRRSRSGLLRVAQLSNHELMKPELL